MKKAWRGQRSGFAAGTPCANHGSHGGKARRLSPMMGVLASIEETGKSECDAIVVWLYWTDLSARALPAAIIW
jgi:hypothetical protein